MIKPKTTVLLVDDNDMMRALLRGILRSEHVEVIGETRDGVHAIEMAERLKPDVILLDIMMPAMDGLEALREIHRQQPDTKVIMITGSPSAENVQESIDNGASAFIVKPFNAAKVLNTLERVLKPPVPEKPETKTKD